MAQKQIVGYHGTTKNHAEAILRCGRFYDSTKDNEWLGHGVYFFEHKGYAVEWTKQDRFKYEIGHVLAADLIFDEIQLLDLDDPYDYAILEDVINKLLERYNNEGKSIVIKEKGLAEKSKQWCFACNAIRKLQPNIGIIIYTFQMYRPTDYARGFFQKNQRQICVSDHRIIHNIRTEVC